MGNERISDNVKSLGLGWILSDLAKMKAASRPQKRMQGQWEIKMTSLLSFLALPKEKSLGNVIIMSSSCTPKNGHYIHDIQP